MGGTEEKPPSKWENSSLHGPPLVCQSELKVEKAFWIAVIILSVVMFAYEAYVILMQYSEDPIAVKIRTKQPTKWPKIHFCPQDWISEAKLVEHKVNATKFKCAILASLAWSNTNEHFLRDKCFRQYSHQWKQIMADFSQTSLGKMDAVSLFKEISYDPDDFFYPGEYVTNKVVSYKGVCFRINFTLPFLLFGDAGKPVIYLKHKVQPLHLDGESEAENRRLLLAAAAQKQGAMTAEQLAQMQSEAAAQQPDAMTAEQLAQMQSAAAAQQSDAMTAEQLAQMQSAAAAQQPDAMTAEQLAQMQSAAAAQQTRDSSAKIQPPENQADDIFLYDSGETLEFLDMPKIKTSESPLILIREEEYVRIDSKDVKCGNMSNEERMSATVACIEIACAKMGLMIPMHPGYNSGKPKRLIEYASFMNATSHCYAANFNEAKIVIRNCFKDAAPSCKSNSYQFSTYPTNDPKHHHIPGARVPVITFGYYNSWSSQMVTEFKIYTWDTLMCNLGGMLSLFTGASLFSLVQLVVLCFPTKCLKKGKVETGNPKTSKVDAPVEALQGQGW